jgi:DNA-binding SARP family transcriptional activator/tetratricopeptide (TPR) repeat protein
MQVRVLGPVDIMLDGGARPVSGFRRQAVLAALALHDGQVVSTGRLVELVWGDSPPPTAINSLQTHISYLRRVLGSKDAIVARPPGYLLNLGSDSTDARTAERLLRRGRQATDPVQGARDLAEALALWRGRPLADLVGSTWLEEQSERLGALAEEIRRALFEARLAAGQHREIVAELEQLAADDPLDEQLHGQLMLALYRCGRQAHALAVFRRVRAALVNQLGIEPGPMLRNLESAILRQDHALAVPARPDLSSPARPTLSSAARPNLSSPARPNPASPAARPMPVPAQRPMPVPAQRPVPVPAQLPPAIAGFAGRTAELARLDAALAQAERERSAGSVAVVISALSGTAGVGKTALALQWAHQVAAQFPDGQLYVNLRGFGPSGEPAEPGEAICGFLNGLGVPEASIANGVPTQAALYRSLVAGKRVLVVLDNARDAEQVRPLLPGSPGCLVIVTSRSNLAGLVATDGAYPVSLDVLTPPEASDVLARRLGEARVASEPEAVAEIIERCARLPLALAIAAARAAARPEFPLAAIAAELRGATAALDPFGGGDGDGDGGADSRTDVRAVFSWSCQALSDHAARLFRLLGLHPGQDIGVHAAASLAGLLASRARPLLADLTRANLLLEYAPGRYSFHDLLRAYAIELTDRHDSKQERQAAVHRELDYYLHAAHQAAARLHPHCDVIAIARAQPGVITECLTGTQAALTWFNVEHRTLIAVNELALRLGFDTHTWQLAWAISDFLTRNGRWPDSHTVHHNALHAAERAEHKYATGYAHRALALANFRLGHRGEALCHSEQALELFGELGEHSAQGQTHLNLAKFLGLDGNNTDALRHAQYAYDHYQAAGNRAGQANSLNSIGWFHAQLGDYRRALFRCQQALATLKELDDIMGAAYTMDSLAYIHRQLGDQPRAIDCYQQTRDLFREIGASHGEAEALAVLGDVYDDIGDIDAARAAWREALDILAQIGHPAAEQVRAKLVRAKVDPLPAA